MNYSSQWQDMSDYLVHFTRMEESGDDYGRIISILGGQVLKAMNAFGIARSMYPETQKTVCFSEIPPGEWERIYRRRKTKHGIAFRKEFIRKNGGVPVWYTWKDSPVHVVILEIMTNAEANDPIWKITPFIDAPGVYPTGKYNFEWEREWRIAGNCGFEPEDVAFLLMPEDLHDADWGFFHDAFHGNTGPAYSCPYIDPEWDNQKITDTLKQQANRGFGEDNRGQGGWFAVY